MIALAAAIAPPPIEPPPFNRKSLAERWGVNERTIDAWIASRKIHAVRLGHQVRISYAEVLRAEAEGIATC
ncbi:excisionase family DNA-binding protein [Posidoniimonas corsicana]|uniref:excisionase family DNA-binding protein n=1 Tax=Posidoniimonas corsicana TaxID=1938618 RepID=UPI0018D46D38|nr:excisionase family DNA-binding protein [Posidoniimonas corsicana]